VRLFLVMVGTSLLVAGCASLVNGSSSDVEIVTHPASARCHLTGADGFVADVTTPVTMPLPHKAAPITVACEAPGYRRTVNTLNAGGSGWLWGNTAFIVVTGGAAVLGLIVDEAVGASTSYHKSFNMDLDAESSRRLRATQRNGGPFFDIRTP
jgi:hypothetical protein